jgi:hypothetical protein
MALRNSLYEIAFSDGLLPLWNTARLQAGDHHSGLRTAAQAWACNLLVRAVRVWTPTLQINGTITPPGLWLPYQEYAIDTDGMHGFGVIAEASGGAQVITLLASVPLTDEAGDSQHYLGDDRRRPPLCRTGGCRCW